MTYYGAKEIAAAFRTVRKNTITIAEEIGEEHYDFQAAPETRTVAQHLVHIALVPRIQYEIHAVQKLNTLAGFDFPSFIGNLIGQEQQRRTKIEIVKMLQEGGEQFASWVETVSDDFLGQRVSMPPGMQPDSKPRFEMLLAPKEHEMHHRAQLMLIERMLGMVPHLTREFQARIAAMQAGRS